MKRQTQVPGVRRWYGDDFLELQSEALNAIDAVVGAYNKPCVISGCEYASGQLTKGFVALSVQNEGLKIMPFDGVAIALPCFLTAVKTLVNTVYADGVARLSAYQYKAVATTAIPAAGVNYIKIEANGKCDRLPDVMQDAAHRMVSDTEKTVWNAKETPAGAQTKATKATESAINAANTYTDQARREARDYTDAAKQVAINTALEQAKEYTDTREAYDYVVYDDESLLALDNAPVTSVLVKKGVYTCDGGVAIAATCRRIVGEEGSQLNAILSVISPSHAAMAINVKALNFHNFRSLIGCEAIEGFNNCQNLTSCFVDQSKATGAAFNQCVGLTQCSVRYNNVEQNGSYGFLNCENMNNCVVIANSIYHRGIYKCINLVNCASSTHINTCYGVYRCKAKTYTSSYYSNASNSTYACADTLNGGWNKTI